MAKCQSEKLLLRKSSSLYVHIPLCQKKCLYCKFYSKPVSGENTDILQAALLTELRRRNLTFIDTVYAGGGTPTLLSVKFWRAFFKEVKNTGLADDRPEITIETNPGTTNPSELVKYREAGFNRLSIGIQSFKNCDLEILGRAHSSTEAVSTYKAARKAGFENINIDLIYGIPGQTRDGWKANLKRLTDLKPEHISCYELSVEEGTPLKREIKSGSLSKPTDEVCAEMYFLADEYLKSKGYFHYEVSSYARGEEYISKHNSKYWNRSPYIGLGPSAHSFDGDTERSWNPASIREYCSQMKDDAPEVREVDILSNEDINLEKVMLGLRCKQGVNLSEVSINADYLDEMIKDGKAIIEDRTLIPLASGMLFADGDAQLLIDNTELPFA